MPQLGATSTPPSGPGVYLQPQASEQSPAPALKLTSRARRLLEEARTLVAQQRQVSNDRMLTQVLPTDDPVVHYHRGTVGLTEAAVRLVQTFPTAADAQLRTCDGFEQLLNTIRDRLATTERAVQTRRKVCDRRDRLAGLLQSIHDQQQVALEPFIDIAEALLDEARRGERMRWTPLSEVNPSDAWGTACRVAELALNTAQVVARVVELDYEWAARPTLPVVAALLMDVGMIGLPADAWHAPDTFTPEVRRAYERHALEGAARVRECVRGAEPLVEAIAAHHERMDGTGFPGGLKGETIPPLGRFLKVCADYAAALTDWPDRPAKDPRTALTDALLMAEDGSHDRDFTEYLLRLGFHPVGSVVELTDGRLATVAATNVAPGNLKSMSRPVVAILTTPDGTLLARPEFLDLRGAELGGIVRTLPRQERCEKLSGAYPDLCL